jgi:hypothetical protein
MQRFVATGLACATLVLVLGLGAGVAAAADAPRPSTASGPAQCARLQERIAQVPGIQQRIRAQIDTLERRLDAVADPQRQARLAADLQPRIDKLEQLGRRLSAQVALAERICARWT